MPKSKAKHTIAIVSSRVRELPRLDYEPEIDAIIASYKKYMEEKGEPTTAHRWSLQNRDFLKFWIRHNGYAGETVGVNVLQQRLKKQDILDYMIDLRNRKGRLFENIADSTRSASSTMVKSLYRYLKVPIQEWGREAWEPHELPRNDAGDRPQPYYTFDEIQAIVDASSVSPRDYAIHRIWASQIIRRNELCRMRVKDFKVEENGGIHAQLYIRTSKHGFQDWSSLDPDTAKAIQDYLATRIGLTPDQALFTLDVKGKIALSPEEIGHLHNKYARIAKVKVKGKAMHAGRRGLVTFLRHPPDGSQPMDKGDIKRIGRWKSESMVERYDQTPRTLSEETFHKKHPYYWDLKDKDTQTIAPTASPLKVTVKAQTPTQSYRKIERNPYRDHQLKGRRSLSPEEMWEKMLGS